MRFFLIAAVIVGVASTVASAQELQLAPEGRGLLPEPAEMPTTLVGTSTLQPFEGDSSGVVSRTIFETSADPDFKITIRDFAVPPDGQPHTITLPSGAYLHFFGEPGGVTIANNPTAIHMGMRIALAAGAPVEVTNNGERSLVIRALIVEGK
jgi:hypothetical protein